MSDDAERVRELTETGRSVRYTGRPIMTMIAEALSAARCRWHGAVDDDHFPCRAPGETAGQFTKRALGETRDV